MSKWCKVGSANACAPSIVRATQRISVASRCRIAFPRQTPFAPFRSSTCNGLRYEQTVDEEKTATAIAAAARRLRERSAPGVDEYHSAGAVANRHGQRGLQRIKELLHIAGA